MQLEPDPDRGSRRATAYVSPNARFGADWEPRHAPVIDVVAPADLVRRSELRTVEPQTIASALGVEPFEHQRVRERISFLEGQLAASARVEAAAQAFADRLEERARAARTQYEGDLSHMREQLDHRERELRTLALEMGKLQGRLEATQQKLLAPREPLAPLSPTDGGLSTNTSAASAVVTSPPRFYELRFWETSRGAFFGGIATAIILLIVSAILR